MITSVSQFNSPPTPASAKGRSTFSSTKISTRETQPVTVFVTLKVYVPAASTRGVNPVSPETIFPSVLDQRCSISTPVSDPEPSN